jgi:hypothetical protein
MPSLTAAATAFVKVFGSVALVEPLLHECVVTVVAEIDLCSSVTELRTQLICSTLHRLDDQSLLACVQTQEAAHDALWPIGWKTLPVVVEELSHGVRDNWLIHRGNALVLRAVTFHVPHIFQLIPILVDPASAVSLEVLIMPVFIFVFAVFLRVGEDVTHFSDPIFIFERGVTSGLVTCFGTVHGLFHHREQARLAAMADLEAAGRKLADGIVL